MMSSIYLASPSSPDLLVCHRVKECCVQLHAAVQNWKQLSGEGFDIASKLVNTLLHQKYTQHYSDGGVLNLDVSLLDAKLTEEREDLYVSLKKVQNDLTVVVDKMGTLTSNVRASMELLITQGHALNQPVFQLLSPAQFEMYCEEVYRAYSQELSLRESIVGDILKQKDRDTVTLYLSSWLHELYIGTECVEHLEALLIETGLR